MAKKQYGFAIVGAGVIGKAHAATLQHIEQAKLVAVCDVIPDRAREIAKTYHCDWYTDLQEMLVNPAIDIVNVCTPSGMHGRHAIAAARAGKHVIAEKPMDVTLDMAHEMIEECKKANVKLAVISQHRFDPATVQVKQEIENGRFGKLLMGTGAINWYRSQAYYDSGDWRGTWELDGGGALMNQGIHTIDVLQYLMGPVASVYAHCETLGHERIEVEDAAVATVRFRNGAIGTIVGTTCAYPGLTTRIEVFGKDGSAVIDNDALVHAVFRDEAGEVGNYGGKVAAEKSKKDETGAADPAAISHKGHLAQIQDMIDALDENREPQVNGEEAIRPLEIILAIYESARTGELVKLPLQNTEQAKIVV
ncbi:Gfo/Idh/MocA family oxidoreductase [Fodinisporobacter ferrooxydans]|uniref:Gfo/Idh/MocA family oxidoreductase n=1 Tax=Fodinisporobacter ferrooxydans TaxID=2901836 RepID=A0ABY4CNQ7_9BACL|nr:Gfo/Idh/MocA family oxidoreductase [Alicyclobacillaceae bacterium MYW30-H2]